jgi:hypothetical protein
MGAKERGKEWHTTNILFAEADGGAPVVSVE